MRGFLQKIILLCAFIGSGIIPPARADEASDYMAAAGDQVKAFGRCTADAASPLIKSQLSADEIADQAVKACGERAEAVTKGLMGSPTNLSRSDAQASTDQVTSDLRKNLVGLVKRKRGG